MDIGLLLWRELFTDLALFPTETTWDNPHPAKAGISNADILKFLTDAIKPSTLAKTAIKKWQHGDSIKLKQVEDLISLSESAFFISYPDVGTFMIQKLKKFI